MPNVEHSTLSGSELHEPKGISSATANQVYVADGTGGGAWKKPHLIGFEIYNDSGSSQSLATTYTDLTNNGTGTKTDKTYRLPGFNDIWDTTNNQFDFDAAGLALGDIANLRFDFELTTSGASSEVRMGVDLAHGTVDEEELIILDRTYKNAGTYNVTVELTVHMNTNAVLTNPAKVKMKSDNATDTVVVDSWYVFTHPRNPVFD